jgi:hypothetical protein
MFKKKIILRKRKKGKTLREKYTGKKKKLVRKIILATVSLFIVSILSVFVVSGYSSIAIDIFPPIKLDAKSTELYCNYGGEDLKLEVNLDTNIYNYYYFNRKKLGIVDQGQYSKFVYTHPKDSTIKNLVEEIKVLGSQNNLEDDQVLELVLCFIQNIPYDKNKAETILSDQNIDDFDLSQYPYETLYRNSGICTDKAYLASSLLEELGYSSALLLFRDENHMALGIKVEERYANFDSDYAMAEVTTPGFIPGDLPRDIDRNDGKPSLVLETPDKISKDRRDRNQEIITESDLSFPTIVIPVNEGRTYERIQEIKSLDDRITSGLYSLEVMEDDLDTLEIDLIIAEENADYAYSDYLSQPSYSQMCGYNFGTWSCWDEPNSSKEYFYSTYVDRLNYYNSLVDQYNSLIDGYNNKIDEINRLIDRRDNYQFN